MSWCGDALIQVVSWCGEVLILVVSSGLLFLWLDRWEKTNESLFCLATPREHIDFHILVKHMVIVTYFFKRNLLSPRRLLFPISSKGSFTCTFPQTGQRIPQPLKDQLWTSAWNGKIERTANSSIVQDRLTDRSHHRWTPYRLGYVSLPHFGSFIWVVYV